LVYKGNFAALNYHEFLTLPAILKNTKISITPSSARSFSQGCAKAELVLMLEADHVLHHAGAKLEDLSQCGQKRVFQAVKTALNNPVKSLKTE